MAEQIGLVEGPSKQDAPPTAVDMEKVENTAIETAEELAGTRDSVYVELSDGRTVECKLAKVRQIGLVLRFIKAMVGVLKKRDLDEKKLDAFLKNLNGNPELVMEMLIEAETHVWPVMASLTDLSREDVMDLDLDDAVKLAKVLFERNQDFFVQKVLPMAVGELRKVTPGVSR